MIEDKFQQELLKQLSDIAISLQHITKVLELWATPQYLVNFDNNTTQRCVCGPFGTPTSAGCPVHWNK